MEGGADQAIHDVLVFGLTALVAAYALWGLTTRMQRSRPGLAIGPRWRDLLHRVWV